MKKLFMLWMILLTACVPPLTSTDQVTPTPSLTPTPVSYEALYKTSETCLVPCWFGFTPGVTTQDEFRAWLKIQKEFTLENPGERAVMIRKISTKAFLQFILLTNGNNIEIGKSSKVYFGFANDDLARIGVDFSVRPTLKMITTQFGFPEYSSVVGRNKFGTLSYQINLYYPRSGIAFRLSPPQSDFGKVLPEMKPDFMYLVKLGTLVDMIVAINLPDIEGTEAERIAKGWIEQEGILQGWKSFGPVDVLDPQR